MGANKSKRFSSTAFGRMPYPRIFQVQLSLDPPPGVVADLAAVIKVRNAGPFGVHELQLQGRVGV